ncbi:MAG: hypothetical protein HQ495_05250 [Alphaproteobacteria bacterium]|nr:hypothetical protein [Alphaproteobacteria bacterium]
MTLPDSARWLRLEEDAMRRATAAPTDDDTPPAWRAQWARGADSPFQIGTTADIAWRFGRELFRMSAGGGASVDNETRSPALPSAGTSVSGESETMSGPAMPSAGGSSTRANPEPEAEFRPRPMAMGSRYAGLETASEPIRQNQRGFGKTVAQSRVLATRVLDPSQREVVSLLQERPNEARIVSALRGAGASASREKDTPALLRPAENDTPDDGLTRDWSRPAARDRLLEADGYLQPTQNAEPEPPLSPPVVNIARDRIDNILGNKPARFEIADNPSARPAIVGSHIKGRDAVLENDRIIKEEAESEGIDPNLLRAIMYVENARGWLHDAAAEGIGLTPSSALPMNINASLWGRLVGDGADLMDPRENIRAAARLLRRISDRIEDATPEKIASIWHFAGAERVDDFGALVGLAMREQHWNRGVRSTPGLRLIDEYLFLP